MYVAAIIKKKKRVEVKENETEESDEKTHYGGCDVPCGCGGMCRAMTYDGKQCPRKPVEGRRYCQQHMGK